MAFSLTDRVVFITGASSGIGRACALAYHAAGCRVIATARSSDKLQRFREEVRSNRFEVFTMDVTNAEHRDAGIRFAVERFGPVDVLVNNAGWASFGSLRHMPFGHAERMVALNFLGPIALIQAVLPGMITRRGGQIVNISSVVGDQPMPRMAVYSATKAALSALSTALRMELRGTGVDVLLIAPGSTRTSFFDSAPQSDTQAVRFAETQYTPERVARAVVRASRRRRSEVTLTLEGKLITWIRRASHGVADAIIERVARKTMPLRESPP